MLVLSRQRDEKIIIGKDIVITIVDIRGDKVRLGIDAPKELPVHRQEIFEKINSGVTAKNVIDEMRSMSRAENLLDGGAKES